MRAASVAHQQWQSHIQVGEEHNSSLSGNGRSVLKTDSAPNGSPAVRCLNVFAASLLLVACAPLMFLIALAIKFTSRGPVIFVQSRVGLNRRNGGRPSDNCRRRFDLGGKPFSMFKFRTMRVADRTGYEEVWAALDDPRVTPLGRFLRKYRLDELPQLVNVLRGEMNLVGPRPEQPAIFSHLRLQIEDYHMRQQIRPGITGWAQVNQHYDTCIDDVRRKLELDLEYVRRRSVLEDLKIMARTVPVILLRRGAW